MIVVADTSPLNYLVLIDQAALLPALFDRVIVPPAVLLELEHLKTPDAVRRWIADPPDWLTCHAQIPPSRPDLRDLDDGEREAIELAIYLGVGTILIDETEGRRSAAALHLQVRGTLGLLEEASRLGITHLASALDKLELTNSGCRMRSVP